MIPGFDDEYMLASIEHAKGLRAIVLELYGTGNASSRKKSFVGACLPRAWAVAQAVAAVRITGPCSHCAIPPADVLMRAIASGIIIVASSQCMRGTVDLGAYALGKKLESIGVVPGRDMTTEAICVKLGGFTAAHRLRALPVSAHTVTSRAATALAYLQATCCRGPVSQMRTSSGTWRAACVAS